MSGRDGPPKTARRRIDAALRRAQALELRKQGVPVTQIATQLGYKQTGHVYQDIDRALTQMVAEPAAAVRAIEIARLDEELVRLAEMWERVRQVRDARHLTVNNGRLITVKTRDEHGAETGEEEPLLDDEPVLRATDRMLAIVGKRLDIAARRAKYQGLDAPTRVAVITDEALDDAIATEQAALANLVARSAADEADDPQGAETAEG